MNEVRTEPAKVTEHRGRATRAGQPKTAEIAVLIVTYNSRDEIAGCLEPLLADPDLPEAEIVVIDNCSSDGTAAFVASAFDRVQVVMNSANIGFGAAVNRAAAITRAPYFLILNPDIAPRPGAVKAMLQAMDRDPHWAVLGCRLLSPDGRPQSSARTFPTIATFVARATPLCKYLERLPYMREHLMLRLLDAGQLQDGEVNLVDWVLGACMLVRRAAFSEVGQFDERFFMYYEDIDLCYRAKQSGWRTGYLPCASMVHTYKRSSSHWGLRNSLMWIHGRSAARFFAKHYRTRGMRTLA